MAVTGYDYEGFAEARAIARRRRRRILLPLAIVAVMLAALIAIAVHNYRAMHADALALSEGVIANLQRRIETEAVAFLRPINALVALSRDLVADDLATGIPRDEVEAIGLAMLQRVPQLTALYVGDRNGEFVMVRRDQLDGQPMLETKVIRRSARGAEGFAMSFTRRDERGRIVSQDSTAWDRYDPRTRPWYEGAAKAGQLHWTEVYPFFTDRAAGITASVPLVVAGEVVGVVGADVTLASISRFLDALEIGRTGQALIMDAQGRLIAHPTARLIHDDGKGNLRLSRVADLDDPVVRRAFDYYRVEHLGRRDFELDGRRYISAVSSLAPVLDRDWSVLMVVPEDDFVGFVADNVRQALSMGLATLALVTLLAWLLIRQGLRTDRDALRVLEREAELDAEGRVFGQLAATHSASFDRDDAQALQPLTESAAHAARVRRVSLWRLEAGGDTLACMDAYDRDTGGHTRDARLTRAEYPELFDAMEQDVPLAAVDAAADLRLAALHRRYLEPLGCRALLAAPLRTGTRAVGALWLEDTVARVEWPAHTAGFTQALANLLAMHGFDGPAPMGAASVAPRATHGTTTLARHPAIGAAFRDLDVDTSLSRARAAAFSERLAAGASAMGRSGAEVIDRLAVLSLHLADARVLAEPADQDGAHATVSELLHELESVAHAEGVDHLKFFSDQVIASIDPNQDAYEALRRLAEFALRVRSLCEHVFARHRAAPTFRIGIDVGPAVGVLVGRESPTFAFWGEAVRTATSMAGSSLPGAIQVTESVYEVLRERYVFQLRGHHFIEGVGEFSTYLLGGRL